MEYRRRRKKRAQRSPGAAGLLILLIVFAATAKIVIGSGIIPELKERLKRNALSGCTAKSGDVYETAVATQNAIPAWTTEPEGVTNRIDLPGMGIYAVQMGFYNSRTECELEAGELKKLGGAGYIYDDGGSRRLLAAAYPDEASAKSVIAQLEAQGRAAALFSLTSNGVSLLVTSSEGSAEAIEKAFALCYEITGRLDAQIAEFDGNGKDEAWLCSELAKLRQEIKEAVKGLPGGGDNKGVLGFAVSFLEECERLLAQASAEPSRAELSSAVKYARIEAALRYRDLLCRASGM